LRRSVIPPRSAVSRNSPESTELAALGTPDHGGPTVTMLATWRSIHALPSPGVSSACLRKCRMSSAPIECATMTAGWPSRLESISMLLASREK
jgi:hypothetical protein